VTAPGFAVFPGELLTRRFPKDGGILFIQVGVLGVPYVTVFIEVLLAASVVDLVSEWGVCGQPLGQALPIPVTDRVSSVRVRSLGPVAHRENIVSEFCKRVDYVTVESNGFGRIMLDSSPR